MQLRGKTAAGTQRWFCLDCRKSSVRKNPHQSARHRKKLFILWLCGTESLAAFAKKHGESRRTFQRWFEPFWTNPPAPKAPSSLENQSLIVDAVSIEPRRMMALIGRTRRHVVWWSFAESESFDSWSSFCSNLPAPKSVVCDGQRGLLTSAMGHPKYGGD
jgi:hypothetical protein